MATDRQIEANRTNAQKSTGPKTPEGRAAVRLNGVKHGLTAATLVLPGEKESDFESLLADFESEHQPATPTEEALVRQMAMAQWRLRRLYHVEAAFFNLRLIDLDEEIDDNYNNLDAADKLAFVVKEDSGQSSVRENLSRIEARLERSFYKALRELDRLRTARPRKSANQTQFQEPTLPPDPEPKLFLVNPVEEESESADGGARTRACRVETYLDATLNLPTAPRKVLRRVCRGSRPCGSTGIYPAVQTTHLQIL